MKLIVLLYVLEILSAGEVNSTSLL